MENKKESSKPKTGLQKLKKDELIDIILRKDEVEVSLRKTIADNDKKIAAMKADMDGTLKTYNKCRKDKEALQDSLVELKTDYENECDENASILVELEYRKRRTKIIHITYFIIIVLLALGIIL